MRKSDVTTITSKTQQHTSNNGTVNGAVNNNAARRTCEPKLALAFRAFSCMKASVTPSALLVSITSTVLAGSKKNAETSLYTQLSHTPSDAATKHTSCVPRGEGERKGGG